jgi:hypothetical protein
MVWRRVPSLGLSEVFDLLEIEKPAAWPSPGTRFSKEIEGLVPRRLLEPAFGVLV